MTNITIPTSPTEDFEPTARESFFVAVCDCDKDSFVRGFGCSHPFHVLPQSVFGGQESALIQSDS